MTLYLYLTLFYVYVYGKKPSNILYCFPTFFLLGLFLDTLTKVFCVDILSIVVHWQKSLYRFKRNMVLVELDQHVESCFSFGKIIILSLRHIILSPPNLVKR